MRKILVLLLFAVISSSVTVIAQDNKDKKVRPTKEQRVEMMTSRMSSKLMLNDSQKAKFTPLYKKYLDEMAAIRTPKNEVKGEMNDSHRDKMVRDGFAHQRKMLDLKEKYYNEFTKFLTPSQAQKVISSSPKSFDKGNMKDGKMKKHDGMKDKKMMRDDGRKRDRMMNNN